MCTKLFINKSFKNSYKFGSFIDTKSISYFASPKAEKILSKANSFETRQNAVSDWIINCITFSPICFERLIHQDKVISSSADSTAIWQPPITAPAALL